MVKYGILAAFLACVPLANWLIGNVGARCVPGGPCLVPVGFGYEAPSGVLVIGIALVLRDLVHESMGARWAFLAVLIGGALSGLVAPSPLAAASITAFLVSETADFAVYAPLRKKYLALAVLASGLVGAAIDSAVFLWLAFGSLDYLAGQVIGKLWATVAAFSFLIMINRRRVTVG